MDGMNSLHIMKNVYEKKTKLAKKKKIKRCETSKKNNNKIKI